MTTPRAPPYNAAWDGNPKDYDARRRAEGWIQQRRALFLRAWFERHGATGHVLELGSGTGRPAISLVESLPHLRWHGIDPLPEYVAFASEKARAHGVELRVNFQTGCAENLEKMELPFSPDFFVSNDVLHHVQNLAQTLHAAARVAKPGARWCAIEPNVCNPYVWFNQIRMKGERNFWPHVFLDHAARAGWRLQKRQTLFLIPSFIPNPPLWLKKLESKLETIPFLGGGAVFILERDTSLAP